MEHRILREPPDDGANSIDMAVHDIQKRVWLLLEGKVCGIREIANRNEVHRLTKRNKTNVSTTHTSQHNIFDCLENYQKDLKTLVYYYVISTNQTHNKLSQRSRVRKKPDIAATEPKVDPVTEWKL